MAPLVTKTELFDVDVLQKLVIKDGITQKDKADLQRYRRRRINGNEVLIAYDFGKDYKTLQLGRIHPSPYCGLAIFPKDIRAALAQKYYWDIDIENAQPNLLVVLAKKYNVDCPALQEYCDRREDILAEISAGHEMNRDEAKQICISVLFGGFRGHHAILPRIFAELKELSLKVSAENPKLFAKCKESNNPYASCLSIYIQNEERIVLHQLDSFFTSKDRSMDVLIYDGGLVRKTSGETQFPSSLLREAEAMVFDKTGYKICLAVKPLHHTFDFQERDEILPANLLINDEYAAKTFVKLVGDRLRKVDGSLWVLTAEGIWSNTIEDLRMLISEFSSRLVFKQPGPMGIKIHDYGGNEDKIPKMMKQLPLVAKKGELPLQLAYMLVESDVDNSEYLELFMSLIHIVTNHKEELKEYLLNWLAHMVQKPFELPDVALIVTGEKGFGKDTLFDFFGTHILGSRYFIDYEDNNQFFDHYDTGRVNKILAKLQEADRAICLKNASVLKTKVTAKTQNPNPKGKTAFHVQNFCRLVLTTNKGNPVDFADGERRFVLLAASGEKKGNKEYFDRIYTTLFTPEGGKAIASYLMARDIKTWNPRGLPKNEYQEFVVESEKSVEERFMEEWDGSETTAHDLFRQYRAYCKRLDYPGTENFKQWVQWIVPLKRKDLFSVKFKGHEKAAYYYKPGAVESAAFLEE